MEEPTFKLLSYIMMTGRLEFYPTGGSDNTARVLRMKRQKERIKHTSLTTF